MLGRKIEEEESGEKPSLKRKLETPASKKKVRNEVVEQGWKLKELVENKWKQEMVEQRS